MSNTQHQNSSTTKLVLALQSKQRADQELVLSKKKSTLGSHKDCTVVLNSDQIQPMHCMVIQGQRGTIVRNFHPDTRINGESFGDAWIGEGDSISIGNVDLLNRANVTNNQLAEANNQMVRDHDPAGCQVAPHQSEAMFELIERLTKMEGVLDHLNEINETNRSRTRRVIKSLRDKSRASEHQLSKNMEEVNRLEAANMALLNELESLRQESVTKGELQRLADTINHNSDHVEKLVSSKDATIIQFAKKNSVLAAELDSIRSQMENEATNTPSISRSEDDLGPVIDQVEQETSESDDAPQHSAPSIEANNPFLNSSSSNVLTAEDHFDFSQNDEVNVDPNHPPVESPCDDSRAISVDESENLNIDSFNTDAFNTEKTDETESKPDESGTAFNTDAFNTDAFNSDAFNTDAFIAESESAAHEENSGDVESAKQDTDDIDQKTSVDPFEVLSMLDSARSEFEASDEINAFSKVDDQGNDPTDLTTNDNVCAENSLTDVSPENNFCNDGIAEQKTDAEDAAEPRQQMPHLVESITDQLDEKFEADALDKQRSETEEVAKSEVPVTELPQRDEPKDQLDNTIQFEDSHAEKPDSLDSEESEMESIDLASLQSRLDHLVGNQSRNDQSNEESSDVNNELVSQPEPSFNTSDFLKEFEKIDDHVLEEVQQETSLEVESLDSATAFETPTPESSKADDDTSDEIEFNFELAESNLTGAFADFQKGPEDNDEESSFANATELNYSEEVLSDNEDASTETNSEFELSADESEQSNENKTAEDSNPYAAFLNEQQNEASATSNESTDFNQTVESESESNADAATGLSTAHLFEQLNQLQESETTPPSADTLIDETSPVQEDHNDSEPVEDESLAMQSENTSSKSDEMNSEESYIHEYMQRLLGNSEVKQDETTSSESPDAPSLLEQTFEEEIRERQEMLKPSEFVPKASAPERQSNLRAMRELANQSAKSALEVSSQKRKFEQQSTLVLIGTGICFFLGAISAMFITEVVCIPTLLSLIFLSLTGFGISHFYDLKNPQKPVKQTAEQTSPNSSQAKTPATLSDVSQLKTSSPSNQNSEPVSSDSKADEETPQ